MAYGNGIILIVGLNAGNSWLLSFASPNFHLEQGETVPIDLTFDGHAEARLFATANSAIMATAILPPNVARTFQKASLMVAVSGSTALNFKLTSTGPLLAVLASCVSTVKAGGINSAGDFSAPKRWQRKPTRRAMRNRARPKGTPAPALSSVPAATSSPITM